VTFVWKEIVQLDSS